MKLWWDAHVWLHRHAERVFAEIDFEQVRNIGVIKHAGFGDTLLTRPFLLLLREHFPNARITYSIKTNQQQGVPRDLVDNIHVMPSSRKRRNWATAMKAYRTFGPQDIIFDLTASTPSFLLTRLTPAKIKVGFQHRNVHKWIYHVAIPRSVYHFEAETYLEQLHPFGIPYKLPLDFRMPTETSIDEDAPIAHFTGAATEYKCWPVEFFAKLISMIADRYPDKQQVIIAGLQTWEKERARKIHAEVKSAGMISLVDDPEHTETMIRKASILISNDTGVRHLAIAHATPTIGIFFATLPFRYWPRWGHHEVVFRKNGAPPSPESVFDTLELLLDDITASGVAKTREVFA